MTGPPRVIRPDQLNWLSNWWSAEKCRPRRKFEVGWRRFRIVPRGAAIATVVTPKMAGALRNLLRFQTTEREVNLQYRPRQGLLIVAG